ncbi:MAG: nitrous oxide reductase family maturation protein NosD [bacterium]|nr:nitrous oxide reductase family maturation protein NosD [bacterium]
MSQALRFDARRKRALLAALWLALLLPSAEAVPGSGLPSFQRLVDATPTGGLLQPKAGIYAGPVVIRRAMRIDGANSVEIRNGGVGTVVTINGDDIVLRGLHLSGSGEIHDTLDACVRVRGHRNTIEQNRLDDCLFGIELQKSDDNLLRGNTITSKPLMMGLRGDGIRLWYSMRNRIEHNRIRDVRDTVVWYSRDNVISDNVTSGSRYALHFMYAQENVVERNDYHGNLVGIFLMYSDDVIVRDNRIYRSVGPTGMGIGFKETSRVRVERNSILYNAAGIYLDVSPYQPGSTNQILDNRIAFNGSGVLFHTDWPGNVLSGNRFEGNHAQVAVRGGGSVRRNSWKGNYWDDYQGFDRDADGIGDTPYKLMAYSDRLWMEVAAIEFFRASPALEALDFLERLLPFSKPTVILEDSQPVFHGDGD